MSETYGKDAGDIQARQAEEAMFEQVAAEMAARDIKKGLWAKALALSDGSAERAKALYIKLRVQALRDEAALKSAQERPRVADLGRQEVKGEAAAAPDGWQDYGAPARPAPAVERARPAASSRAPARAQHTDQSKTFLGGETHPWRRFFARTVDSCIAFLILIALMFGAAEAIPRQAAGVLMAIGNTNQIIINIVVFLLLVPIEAVFISQFGATPGKGLFGIKVTHPDGSLLSFGQALDRSFRVLAQGLGFGFVLFTVIAELFAYNRLTKTGTTLWDTATDAEVQHQEWGAFRMLACIAAVVVSVSALGILSSESTYGDAPQSATTAPQQQQQQTRQDTAPARAANTQPAPASVNIDAPVDEYGTTALIKAAGKGDMAGVERLLAAGANVNAANNNGWTALMAAARSGKAEVVGILINAGANVNATQADGATALMSATRHGHVEVVRRLILAGADVNMKQIWRDPDGKMHIDTVLGEAKFMADNPHVVRSLANKGVPVGFGHAEIIQLLLATGARE